MRLLVALLALVTLTAAPVDAAVSLPQKSPGAAVKLMVGTTKVEIEFHRPGVKGREIWGGLVPFDTIWRLGANEATTLKISDTAKVGGQLVPEGTYALFAIPGKETWTIVLNRKADQWGTYAYDPALDLARFTVQPEAAPFVEWMSFALEPTSPRSAAVILRWEKLQLTFPIEVDVPGIVWGKLLKEVAEKDADWEDFFQAARYSLDEGGHSAEALAWVDRAIALKPGFWPYELKARLLHREGRVAEAAPWLEKAMADATGKAPQEYLDNLGKTLAEWRKALESSSPVQP